MKKIVIGLTFLFISLQFLLPLAAQVADLYEMIPDENRRQDRISYNENGEEVRTIGYNGYIVTKYNGNEENVVVPRIINGLSISKIGERAFAGNKDIISVDFAGSFDIESESFADCPNLRIFKAKYLRYNKIATDMLKGCKDVKVYTEVNSNVAIIAFLNDFEIIDESEYLIEEDFAYRLEGGVPYLIKYLGKSESVTIPSQINGVNISSRTGDNLFSGNPYVKEITSPENINHLSGQMFAYCPNLTDVYINGDINGTNGRVFPNSPNITVHMLPDNFAYSAAAKENLPIEYYHAPDSFIDGDFICNVNRFEPTINILGYVGTNQNAVIPSIVNGLPVASILGNGFANNKDIVSITIPSSVQWLYYNVFYNCQNLTEVIIEGSMTYIGEENPFGNKTNEDLLVYVRRGSPIEWGLKKFGLKLEYITYPGALVSGDFEYIILDDGTVSITGYLGENTDELVIPETIDDLYVVGIHNEAFKGYSINKIVLPYSIMSIGDYAFSSSALEEINLPDGLTSIGDWAFSSSPIKKIVLPDALGEIGHGTFMRCTSLTEVQFGEYLRYLGPEAFSFCTNLTEISLPDGLEVIGEKAFRYCINVTKIDIPDTVTEIGSEVFSEMTKLKEVKLPSKLKLIPVYAFYGCWELKEIDVPEGITTLGYRAFMHSKGLQHIKLPSTLIEVNPAAFENENRYPFNDLKKLTIPEYIVDRYKEMIVPHCPYVSEIIVQPGIKEVKRFTFSDLKKIRIIELPDTVTTISNSAFSNCTDLEYIYIPKTVKEFGDNIFTGCSKLTIVTDKEGTLAEEYAKENDIKVIYLEEYRENRTTTQQVFGIGIG